jgi:teichuronic acid biosynthesis glycosyltransferase TuaC
LKILIVCRQKSGAVVPYISEQVESLKKVGIDADYYHLTKNGLKGYLSHLLDFKEKIKVFNPDIIHAHYGLSGLLANFQRKVPVVTTFHGSDINLKKIRRFSIIAMWLSKHAIFVSSKLATKARAKKKYSVIPCGIDLEKFSIIEKEKARKLLGFENTDKLVLFSGSFDNPAKNYPLAKQAVANLKEVILIELKGYSREEVNLLMNACDLALMTSIREGSPQFIKEAMACNCPVVSVDVGSVKEIISGVKNCFICNYDAAEIGDKINKLLISRERSDGHKSIDNYDNKKIADEIMAIYNGIIN